MPEIDVWSIFFLPLGSFVLIALLRPVMGSRWRGAGYLTVAAMAAAFVLSVWALIEVINAPGHDLGFETREWLTVGSLTINVGITMDGLTAVMAVIVTGVSLLVQVYGLQYMKDDESFTRYFAYMSLFTASMLGLVMASGLVFLFVFWELVGLSSYLLIGFWFRKPEAARAAKKAFLVTRLGDVGFMIAIAWAFVFAGTLDIEALNHAAEVGAIAGVGLTWLCLGIFAGAVGKSGQFPLHVWLPDAMEGPTPVSALIHAATMVAAGVFLVARMFPLFEHSESALTVVAWIGGGTAMLAATMALVNNDIKRVLAFSTVSQLGYMFLALGTGAFGAAIFHLLAHAFFKALLFLGAGSVHHTTETYDMRYMGGLGRFMPRTYGTMMIGALALVGIFPLAGFWSKDAILLAASENTFGIGGGAVLYWIAVLTAGITGFYVFRMLFMTFSGEYKGGAEAEAAAQAPAGNGEADAAVAASDHGSAHGTRRAARIAVAHHPAAGGAGRPGGLLWAGRPALGLPQHRRLQPVDLPRRGPPARVQRRRRRGLVGRGRGGGRPRLLHVPVGRAVAGGGGAALCARLPSPREPLLHRHPLRRDHRAPPLHRRRRRGGRVHRHPPRGPGGELHRLVGPESGTVAVHAPERSGAGLRGLHRLGRHPHRGGVLDMGLAGCMW